MNARALNRNILVKATWGLLLLLPCLAILIYIVRNYVLVPYSDPANWLALAKQLGTSAAPVRFPIGYPLYLRLALKATGPLYVFFANVPWVLAMLALTGVLAYQSLRPGRDRAATALGAFLAMLFLAAAGMDVWILLANPYRDALAHVLMLAALAVAFAPDRPHIPPAGAGRIFAAGVLIGLGYCVREPTVLVAAPLAVYLWIRARQTSRLGFLSVAWLAAGLALGALPVLLQSLLQYGRIAISPYSLHEGQAIPGFNWNLPHAWAVAGVAGRHFLNPLHGFFLFCVLPGAGFAFARRASLESRTLLGTALLYFVFYSFYWRFFPRYFFVVALLAAPLAAGGLLGGIEWIVARLRRPTWASGLTWLCAAALGAAALLPLLRADPKRDQSFRLEQARRLQRELAQHVPAGALILGRDRMTQIIRTLTPQAAYEPGYFWGPAPAANEDLSKRIAALQAEYGAVYWLENERRRFENPWRAPLAAVAGFSPVARWRTTDFNLHGEYFGWSDFILYRIDPPRPAAAD